MLWTISPNISIITNWGCRRNCWYCVWEKHPLKNVCLDTDWEKLEGFLKMYQYKGKVSISGGGDSLFKFEEKKHWWNNLFKLCNKYKLKIDIHTREKLYNRSFWEKINKCVLSCDVLSNDISFFNYILNITKLRITKVITYETTDKNIEDFIDFCKVNKCELTFKELYGFEYKHNKRYKEIKAKYPQCFYLDTGDYNIYYMPDNSITDKFLK